EADGGRAAEALFAHWRGAGDVGRSLRYGAQVAAHAAEVLAFDRAARLYRELVELAGGEERRRLQVGLGEALAHPGGGAAAAEAYRRAIPGAPAEEALELGRRVAEQLLRSGRVDAGLAALRDVLAAVGLRMPRAPALETLARRTVLALGRHGWRPRAA